MFYVYGLIDPISKELRYVGKTNNLKVRYRDHINKLYERNYKSNWIKSLISKNNKPEMVVLETHEDESECFAAEIRLIEYFKSIGSNLTNLTSGGEGTSGSKHSQETKDKLSLMHIGMKHTEETKEKLRAINTGKKATQETKDKMSNRIITLETRKLLSEKLSGINNPNYGKKPSEDTLKLISTNRKLAATEESIKKIVENNPNRKLSSDQISEIRSMYSTGKFTQKELSIKYDVNQAHISKIVNFIRGIL